MCKEQEYNIWDRSPLTRIYTSELSDTLMSSDGREYVRARTSGASILSAGQPNCHTTHFVTEDCNGAPVKK